MGQNASGEGVQSPLPGAQRSRAIAALLPGSAEAAAVGRFEALLATRNCPPEAIKWMQPPGGSPLAAVVVPSPGGVGMLVASPLPGPGAAAGLTSVTRAALTAGLHQGLHFVQVLLPLDDKLRHTCMLKAGFRPLATLHTMTRGLLPRRVPDLRTRHAPPATTDVQLVPCLQLPTARVAAMLDATAQATLDCPGLCGLRPGAAAMEGHLASGTPIDELWCLIQRHGVDVGVVLVARNDDGCDLVYMGLTPAARSQGLGSWTLGQVLQTLRSKGERRIRLCVDSENAPAIAMYSRAGFASRSSALALIATAADVQDAP